MVRETYSGTGNNGDDDMVMKPAWLDGLIGETYFAVCGLHQNWRRNEKNIFCLDCCLSFCPHCLPSHHHHSFIQVRRYVYHDVVRLDDLQKLIDCSYIQPYTINNAKVIFLNARAQTRSCKGPTNICFNCDRILQDPFHFCSLSCKVDYMVHQGDDLSRIIYIFNQSDFTFTQFEGLRMDGEASEEGGGQITPDSILENQMLFNGSSVSNETMASLGNSSYSEVAKKKKKNTGFLPGIVLSMGSRRKGAPHRSPLS